MSKHPELNERIKFLRTLTGLTAKEFCERYNVSLSSFSKWESGIMPISVSKAKMLVAIAEQGGISCTLSWLLYGKGQEAHEFKNTLDQNETNNKDKDIDTETAKHLIIAQEQEIFKNIHKSGEVLIICDKSMEPQFKIGEYVAGTPIDLKQIKKYLDHPCIVTTEDGKVRLRRIGYNSKSFFLYGTNTRYIGAPLFELSPKFTRVTPIFWHRMLL